MDRSTGSRDSQQAFGDNPYANFFQEQSRWMAALSQMQFQAMHPESAHLPVPDWLSQYIDADRLQQIRQEYAEQMNLLLTNSFGHQAGGDKSALPSDRRFSNPAWHDGGMFEFMSSMYLINARAMNQLAEAVQSDAKTRAKIKFAVGQWVDAMSPANFLATNPEAQRKIVETKGESLKAGITNLVHDLQQGRISMTDESRFEVGKNVATTEGMVVFENEVFQLIQYKPLSPTVGTRPLLMVPPCINKYYILDLQPSNSLARYAVEQGTTVFMVSWRNPTLECAHWTWDTYVEEGVIRAIEVASDLARAISKADQINVLGFCVGGTLVAAALAALALRGKKPAASLTLLTTLLDFSNTGVLDVFIDEAQVRMREETIGHGGLMTARDLATTFSFLRPNDLVWPYVVGNYLKGEAPPAFDLLYWNGDSTNLPGPMYAWYLRNTYLENKLIQPNQTSVGKTKIDLGRIDIPVYIYGSREDHIVPWDAAYASTQALTGMDLANSRFILGASGHIAGVINPASSGKRNFWRAKPQAKPARGKARPVQFPADAQTWLAAAESVPGSWWSDWSTWLEQWKGPRVKAPGKFGSAQYAPIEPAPGRYVKVRVV